jgi:competence protein ComEC
LFALGFYTAQTGGILKTELLSSKRFLEEDCDKSSFFANVEFIEETHPTMKGMQRITLENIKFDNEKTSVRNVSFGLLSKTEVKKDLEFIKTAKMTCHSRMLENINPNDRVKIIGRLLKYKESAIPGSFDQKQYNSLIKIDATGIVFYIKNVFQHEENRNVKGVFASLRRYLTKTIMTKISKPSNGVAAALLTGDKSAIGPDVRDKFIKSGTAHILAISGLHMSIVASIAFLALLKIALYVNLAIPIINPRKLAAGLTVPITFTYLALSGFSPSAVRAFIMTSIFLISVILGRGAISLRSVSIAAFLILLFDSAALFLVSFQLSFCAVVALISFYENYNETPLRYFSKNSVLNKIFLYLFASILSTLIASLATLPISVSTFNRLSLTGILGNLVALPLISFIIAPLGIICIIFSSFFSFLLKLIEYCLNFLIEMVGYISNLPGSDITLRSPCNSSLYICIFGGILLCLLKTRLKYVGVFAIAFSVILYYFEESPDIIFPPNSNSVCYIENGEFYTTSVREGRNKILSIQRNLGFSGKPIKKELENNFIERRKYGQGLFIWTKNGKIIKRRQIAKRIHPYCPAYFEPAN